MTFRPGGALVEEELARPGWRQEQEDFEAAGLLLLRDGDRATGCSRPGREAGGGGTQRLAARLGRAATYCAQGWRERTKGMLNLVAVVGDDSGGGRSGRRRRQHAHVAMVAFPRVDI